MGKIRGLALAWALAVTGAAMAAVIGEAERPETVLSTEVSDCPTKVAVAGNLAFTLETMASRIAVYDMGAGEAVGYYGATKTSGGAGANYTNSEDARAQHGSIKIWAQGAGNGGFKRPGGLALDTFGGGSQLAVADTENNRVQLFSFDAATGEITFQTSYAGDGENALNGPLAVAFMEGGDLLVADSGNHRVVRLACSGGALSHSAAYDFGENDTIKGLCYDKDTAEGFWVTRGQGPTQCVSFHHFEGFVADTPVVALGTPFAADAFDNPSDVQAWKVDGRTLVVVADCNNSRVRILHPVTGAAGDYSKVKVAADIDNGNLPRNEHEDLSQPQGVFPVQGEATLYVADTGHKEVKRYGMTFEEVEDPEEVAAPVWWSISSFELVDDGATARVGWKVPTTDDGHAPEGEDFKFLLLFNALLADLAQVDGAAFQPEDANYTVGQSEEGGSTHTEDFPLDGVGMPSSGFFRLWWLNKVAE